MDNTSGNRFLMYALAGCGGFGAVALIGLCVLGSALTSGAQGGTRYANNMERYALRHIEEHHLLEPGEVIVVYNDGSLALDGSQAAMVTNRRVISFYEGVTTAIALADIEHVEHVDEGMIGDTIDVSATDGRHIHIEIAPMNGGARFLSMLERERERIRGADVLGPEGPAADHSPGVSPE